VRQNVAHTWPEVYFPGYGWQRFEPTPASYAAVPDRAETSEELAAREQESATEGSIGAEGGLSDFELQLLEERYRDQAARDTNLSALRQAMAERAAAERRSAMLRGGAFAAGFGGILLIVLAFVRRSHQFGPAGRVYDRVLRLAQWAGLSAEHSATPVEVAAQIADRLPKQRRPLQTVASAYTRERYAPDGPASAAEVEPAWRELRWPLVGALVGRLAAPPRRNGQVKRRR
jgi:transglutaminase-like putative cysteine protease